ncbi:MAG: pilus assembly protein PilM, partial [Planctomycetota bacterium JB042]
ASFNVSPEKARKLKHEMADVSPFDSAPRRSSQEEKVARALSGATGQVFSMVQSSVMFAKSQTGVQDLSLDRVFLCGGGSLLKGLDRYLASNLNVPVERFDPFESIDVSAVEDDLDDEERAGAVVALGLAFQGAYDECYSIEILPPSLEKARRFQERTVFAVLAGVLVALFLGFDTWRSKADHEAATKDARTFAAELRKRQRVAEEYADAVVSRAENAKKIELLEERVVAGVGLDRALGMVQRYLPRDLYVKEVELVRTKDEELGIGGASKPAVEVRGEGREGVEGLEQLFNRFVTELARDPLLPRTPKTKTSPSGPRKAFEWSVTMNFSEPPPSADDGVPDDEEAADGSE